MIYILSLITLIAIIQAYRSYPTILYTHSAHPIGTFITVETLKDFECGDIVFMSDIKLTPGPLKAISQRSATVRTFDGTEKAIFTGDEI